MLLSYNWLKEFVNTKKSAHEMADLLTHQGIEVTRVDYLGSLFKGVISAQIKEISKHPNADKLSVCKVNDGTKDLQIVCGASNIFPGAKIALSLPGAELINGFKIEKTKIRGVESFGMICSEKELGISDESQGILILPDDVKIGGDVKNILELDDYIFEIEVTPNRGDCLSVLGIAREAAAGLQKTVNIPQLKKIVPDSVNDLEVKILDMRACSRYMAYVVDGVTINESPLWIRNKLRKSGLRSINSIVDITNYVLLELGHPLHAFDYSKIKGNKIIVKKANEGEVLKALDGIERQLSVNDLVIADSGRPIALAGIIGGEDTGVKTDTKKIVLESAYFDPVIIRQTAKRIGISTESSYRFERGVCWNGLQSAMERAFDLIKQVLPNAHLIKDIDVTAKEYKKRYASLRQSRVQTVLGRKYDHNDLVSILTRVGFEVKRVQEGQYRALVPSYRNDIHDEIDLIEEISRIDGYDNIPENNMSLIPSVEDNIDIKLENRIKTFFKGIGFCEARNYSFTSQKMLDAFIEGENHDFWQIENPLTDNDRFLVATRIPRLLKNVEDNIKHQILDIKLFETGKCFKRIEFAPALLEKNERKTVAGAVCGNQSKIFWQEKEKPVDFYYIKGIIHGLLNSLDILDYDVVESSKFFLDNTGCAEIVSKQGRVIGYFGKLAKGSAKMFDLKIGVYVWELYFDELALLIPKSKKYEKYSLYPMVYRDLSLIISKQTQAKVILTEIQKTAGEFLTGIEIFDVYEGSPIEQGYKNISFRLNFKRKDKTLSDTEVNKIQEKILKVLAKNYNTKLRN
ncbi:phenylalanine--tRNA ligase subunit beta [bacterium]